MHVALWVIAGWLAVVFAVGGASKLAIPRDRIATMPGGGWVRGFSPGAVRALGIVDLLAAAGLVLPAALDVVPVLVPVAAVGVVLLMAGAVVVRLRQGAAAAIVVDALYLLLAALVAVGRFGPESFTG